MDSRCFKDPKCSLNLVLAHVALYGGSIIIVVLWKLGKALWCCYSRRNIDPESGWNLIESDGDEENMEAPLLTMGRKTKKSIYETV